MKLHTQSIQTLSSYDESRALRTINELRAEGFDYTQIKDAMCDGEVLASYDISQDMAEWAYRYCDAMATPQDAYYIRAKYYYSQGTYGAPTDGVWADPETGRQTYETREEAQKIIDDMDNNTYHLSHGEMGRPDFTVRKARANQNISKYADN